MTSIQSNTQDDDPAGNRNYPLAFQLAVLYIRLLQFVKDQALQQLSSSSTQTAMNSSESILVCTESWWRMTGSNRRPPACKAGALPAELIPL